MNPNMPRLWGQTVSSILRQEWGGPIEFLFRANDNPFQLPYDNVTYNYNYARRMFLAGGYDALLCVEADMVIPPDALRRLLACDADVAYGLYVFRHTQRTWSAYARLDEYNGRSISQDADKARTAWGQVIDVEGVGMGCTLIRRRVLEHLGFHLDPVVRMLACDWLLARDCQRYRYTQRCDLGVVCGHLSYKPYPQILWPDPDYDEMYRVETLPGVTFEPIQSDRPFEIRVGMGRSEILKAPVV
jgi:hypothetical protein